MSLKLHPSYITDIQSLGLNGESLSDLWIKSNVPMYSDSACLLLVDNPCSMEVINIADIRFKDRPTITIMDKIGNELYVDEAMAIDENFGAPTPASLGIMWGDVLDKPTSFNPATHNHSWANITSGKPTTLAGYGITDAFSQTLADARYPQLSIQYTNPTWLAGIDATTIKTGTIDLARLPAMPSANTIVCTTIPAMSAGDQLLVSKGTVVIESDTGNTYRYSGTGSVVLTASYIQQSDMTPDWAVVTNKPTNVSTWTNDAGYLTAASSLAWGKLTGVPATFTPSAHTHLWADLTDKPSTFAPSAHVHAIADTTGLQAALDSKQPTGAYLLLTSPLTGYVVGSNAALAATDTVLGAFNKIQAQINNKQASGSYSLSTHNHDAAYLGISANAVSATKLATARTISGTSFDGTGNISISYSNLTGLPTLGTLAAKSTVTWTSDLTGVPTGLSQVSNPSTNGNLKIGGTTYGNNWHGIEFSDNNGRCLLINNNTGDSVNQNCGIWSSSEGWIFCFDKNKSLISGTVPWGSVTGIPSTFTPSAHNQAWSTITGTPTTLSGYGIASTDTLFDSRYLAKSAGVGTGEFKFSNSTYSDPDFGVSRDAKFGGTGIATASLKVGSLAGFVRATAGVISASALVASDIPALDWSKITTGKPTTLAGYGITDAVGSSDSRLTNTRTPTNNDWYVYGDNGTGSRSLTDFNAIVKSGFGSGPSATGSPTTGWYHIITNKYAGDTTGWLFQIAAGFGTTASPAAAEGYYVRIKEGTSAPTAWRKLWHSGNFDPATKSNTGHTHTQSEIGGLETRLNNIDGNWANYALVGHAHTLASITGTTLFDVKSYLGNTSNDWVWFGYNGIHTNSNRYAGFMASKNGDVIVSARYNQSGYLNAEDSSNVTANVASWNISKLFVYKDFQVNGVSTFAGNITTSGNVNAANVTLSGQLTANRIGAMVDFGWIDGKTKDVTNISNRLDTGFYQNNTPTTANGWPVNGNWWHLISSTHTNTANYYALQLAADFYTQDFRIRSTNGNGATSWSTIWTSTNLVDPARRSVDNNWSASQSFHGNVYSNGHLQGTSATFLNSVTAPNYIFSSVVSVTPGMTLPLVNVGKVILLIGATGWQTTYKAVTSSTQLCRYRLSTGVMTEVAAGGNVINLDLNNTAALLVGVADDVCQLFT